MKRFFFITFFLLVSLSSHGVTLPATPWYNTEGTSVYNPSSTVKYFSTRQPACDYYYTRLYGGGTYKLNSATVGANNLCYLQFTNLSNGAVSYNSTPVMTAYQCLSGWTLSGTTCTNTTCPTGMTADSTGACIDNCQQYKGQIGTFSLNCSSQTSAGQGVCFPNNCAATITDASSARVGTCWYGYNQAKYTGLTCSGQPSTASFVNPSNTQPPPPDSDQANCIKNGQSFGTVNGVTVCVPKTSSGATPVTSSSESSTSTKNTDATGNTTTQNSTEVKSVTQDGDQVTSQIIKNNPDGTKSETTVTQSYDDFCASNPNQKICKKANDEDTASACEDNPDLPQCYQRGEAVDGDTIGESTRTVSFAAKSITSAASCPSNKSMSAFGRSLTIDYSPVCTYAADFKPFILAFAYLSAAMFLFWGYRGSQA